MHSPREGIVYQIDDLMTESRKKKSEPLESAPDLMRKIWNIPPHQVAMIRREMRRHGIKSESEMVRRIFSDYETLLEKRERERGR